MEDNSIALEIRAIISTQRLNTPVWQRMVAFKEKRDLIKSFTPKRKLGDT